MLDTADTGGVVIPAAIIAACFVVILVAVIARRRKMRRAQESSSADSGGLDKWQTTHGHEVDRWLDAHEGSLPSLVPGADPAIDAALDKAMAAAADQCPDPGLAAMLAGMREAAVTTRMALTDSDRAAAEAAHEKYGRHRADAIARMR